jgi:anti-repressor protein
VRHKNKNSALTESLHDERKYALQQNSSPRPQAPTQLIPVSERHIGGAGVPTVDARELHGFLEVKTEFRNWISNRIEDFDFTEGEHFAVTVEKSRYGKPTKDYHLTLDMSKQLAMVERNDKGKQARQYFIECERRAKASALVEQTSPAALRRVEDRLSSIEGSLQAVADTVRSLEAFGPVDEIAGTYSIDDAAKMLRIAPDSLWLWLRQEKFLTKTTPAQKWIASGHMTLKPSPWTHKETGERHIYLQPRVTAKGVVMLRKRLEGQEVAK